MIGAVKSGLPKSTAYPHQTEDTAIATSSIDRVAATPTPWFGYNAPPCSKTVADAFGGQVRSNRTFDGTELGAYVGRDVRTRSLWAVRIDRTTVTFCESNAGKLKVLVSDGQSRYNLPVSSVRLKSIWRAGGLAALERALPSWGSLHVRIGLARAFGTPPDQCYMMLNDIHW